MLQIIVVLVNIDDTMHYYDSIEVFGDCIRPIWFISTRLGRKFWLCSSFDIR